MIQLSIPLSVLAALSEAKEWSALSASEMEQQVRAAFTFLGSEIEVAVEGDMAHIKFLPPKKAKQDEAARLMERAEKRAQAGEYARAIELYERLLKLDPTIQPAWRNLAMARMELGRNDEARDALIDALRLDPRDAWSYVVLANIYAKHRREYAQARTFYERALELKPDDPWALNGLAAALVEMGDGAAGLKAFDRAIAVAPSFANAWCGKALVLVRAQNGSEAASVLETMFRQASTDDVRSGPVFQEARRLYVATQELIATATESEAFKAVEDFRAAAERESGFPVKVEEGELPAKIAASAQMAWKHSRDHHRIVLRKSPPPQRVAESRHLLAHELTHIRLEAAARDAGRNCFFATNNRTREIAIRELEPDLRRLHQRGFSPEAIGKVTTELINGLCGFCFNCPLDMLIERRLRAEMPALRAAQFLSLARLIDDARQATLNEEIRKLTPPRLWRATSALNGAYALLVDNLYGGATAYWSDYAKLETAPLAQKLWAHWSARTATPLAPGAEYELVDEFAEILGLSTWFEWRPDGGASPTVSRIEEPDLTAEGTTNPELLRAKHPAAVFYLLDALKRFAAMEPADVRQVVLEVAIRGQEGLDYASAEKKYRLRAFPGEDFSGLQLMCLMFAGSKRIAPELDPGMDLEEPFLTALEMFNKGQD